MFGMQNFNSPGAVQTVFDFTAEFIMQDMHCSLLTIHQLEFPLETSEYVHLK